MRTFRSFLLFFLFALLLAGLARAEDMSVGDMMKNGKALDGQTVSAVGTVAQPFERDGRTMFMLTQEKKAVSVMAPPGVSVANGQTVRVTGTWREKLRTTGGASRRGIEAQSITAP